jgi:hypothetical protein
MGRWPAKRQLEGEAKISGCGCRVGPSEHAFYSSYLNRAVSAEHADDVLVQIVHGVSQTMMAIIFQNYWRGLDGVLP